MLHSVIIPHRDANRYLRQCLFSIMVSAQASGVKEDQYEVLIVDNGSPEPPHSEVQPAGRSNFRLVEECSPMADLNKPRLLNAGIEASRGDLLTFLDADAIVGSRWMFAAAAFAELLPGLRPQVTKVCWRVRLLANALLDELDASADRRALIESWFARYDTDFTLAYEAYVKPELNEHMAPYGQEGRPIFGNSQFSILRETLAELRFDERYDGRGYEDLPMNRTLWERDKGLYNAILPASPEHAMFHFLHPPRPGWGPNVDAKNTANRHRYNRERTKPEGKS